MRVNSNVGLTRAVNIVWCNISEFLEALAASPNKLTPPCICLDECVNNATVCDLVAHAVQRNFAVGPDDL